MSEVKDPAIKLFGKTIPLPPNEEASSTHIVGSADGDDHEQQQQHCSSDHNLVSSTTSSSDKICNRVGDGQEDNKKPSSKIELAETRKEDGTSQPTAEERKDSATPSENPQTPSVDEEPISPKVSKIDEQSETSISQEKTLKKPDKILPCPRCNSMDTKFCYYNNYTANQPRHFCRNCQRYWTAGGTMRNVPVGSGRRKNKSSSASHYRHIIVSEALQAARAETTLRTNGTVLHFGSDHESIASALNQAEKSRKISVSCGRGENGDDHSCRSSITASDSADKGGNSGLKESVMKNSQTLPPQVSCFPGPPWPCSWNSSQWRPAIPPPAFVPSGFPVTFYPPPAYWGCTLPGPWNVPWLSPPPASPEPPALGKHSREGQLLKLPSNSEKEEQSKENNSERSVWIPKTLRIDDPNEAAKSSIWSTPGIKNERNGTINGGGLFKAFQSKADEKNHRSEASLVLQANPAAFSRSINFCEST